MADAGTALMAVGEARGEGRAIQAAHSAINSPLLDASIAGARGVLINITGGPDLTLTEVSEASNAIYEVVDPNANILIGAVVHPRPQPEVKLTLIATGLAEAEGTAPRVSRELGARQSLPPRQRERRPADFDERDSDLLDEPPGPVRRRDTPDDPDDDLDLPAFLRRRRPH
jgi:cell division protein FtsZ